MLRKLASCLIVTASLATFVVYIASQFTVAVPAFCALVFVAVGTECWRCKQWHLSMAALFLCLTWTLLTVFYAVGSVPTGTVNQAPPWLASFTHCVDTLRSLLALLSSVTLSLAVVHVFRHKQPVERPMPSWARTLVRIIRARSSTAMVGLAFSFVIVLLAAVILICRNGFDQEDASRLVRCTWGMDVLIFPALAVASGAAFGWWAAVQMGIVTLAYLSGETVYVGFFAEPSGVSPATMGPLWLGFFALCKLALTLTLTHYMLESTSDGNGYGWSRLLQRLPKLIARIVRGGW